MNTETQQRLDRLAQDIKRLRIVSRDHARTLLESFEQPEHAPSEESAEERWLALIRATAPYRP